VHKAFGSAVEESAAEDYRLDFGANFYLNRSVSAAEDSESVRELTAVDSAAAGQHAAASFTTTHWSVVLEAQDETPAAKRALEILCRTYWRPLYGFVRRHGLGREEAQDLVQEFFERLLEHRNLDTVRREKGRLRSYLLVSLKRLLASEQHRAGRVKRYETGLHIPLNELTESEVTDFELAETMSADRLYERRWALGVLEQVLGRLESEYQAAGNAALFDRLKEFLIGEQVRPRQAEIGADLGMTENAVKQAFHRFRQRYRMLLREEIAHTVIAPGDVEDELRHLVSVLRR
jgi:RNA polymerase sigma factor (sigma-70 family)